MKEIKILIRIDDKTQKIGFAISRDKKDLRDISESLKVIGVLELLKKKEAERMEKVCSKTI